MKQLNLIPKLNLNHILYLLLFYTAGKNNPIRYSENTIIYTAKET